MNKKEIPTIGEAGMTQKEIDMIRKELRRRIARLDREIEVLRTRITSYEEIKNALYDKLVNVYGGDLK